MNTREMIERLVATNEHLADAACEITVEIDEILTARQWIDALFERNRGVAEQVLDAISDSYGTDMSGSWKDDGENMILMTWDEYEMEYGDEQ
jgi:methyl-accepting chemotaxis protein